MPAPAPCANTRQALDWGEQSNTPDTLTDSPTAIVTCCGAVVVTWVVCPRIRFVSPMPETGHERYGRLIHIFGKKTPGGGRFMAQYHGSKGGSIRVRQNLLQLVARRTMLGRVQGRPGAPGVPTAVLDRFVCPARLLCAAGVRAVSQPPTRHDGRQYDARPPAVVLSHDVRVLRRQLCRDDVLQFGADQRCAEAARRRIGQCRGRPEDGSPQ